MTDNLNLNVPRATPEGAGRLFVVSTPIGNLADMSARAITTLKEVDVILAEDTRHAKKLLSYFGITTPAQAFHEHNEAAQTPQLVAQLAGGRHLALISDAGTPLVSDPGYRLVAAAQAAGVQAETVPGASALIAALSIAGLPTNQFFFAGFLPAKKVAREAALQELGTMSCTVVVYESKHRIVDALASMERVLGTEREIVLARELTKKFETVLRGTVREVRARVEADTEQKRGEFVLLIRGVEDGKAGEVDIDKVLKPLLKVMPTSQAVKVAQEISGESRKKIYQRALDLDNLATESQ